MFFLLPVGTDYSARRYPVVTFTLMGICTIVWIATLGGMEQNDFEDYPWALHYLWLIPAKSYLWTYLTSIFVHAGFFHLLGNMIYLFLFGSCVEDMIGRVRFIIFFLLCGLAAEFAYIAMTPGHFASDMPLGGASGAIAGCMGGFMLLLPKTQIEFKYFVWLWLRMWAGDFFLPAWVVVSFYFVQDFAMMLANAGEKDGGGVAFAAHVGGTLFGLGLILIRKLWLKPEEEDEVEEIVRPVVRPGVVARAVARAAPAPETAAIYLFQEGAQTGPFTLSQIQGMFTTGSVSPDTLYWQEGMEDWRPSEELREPGV